MAIVKEDIQGAASWFSDQGSEKMDLCLCTDRRVETVQRPVVQFIGQHANAFHIFCCRGEERRGKG